MKIQTTQLRVTLPMEMQDYLKNQADRFGLTMSGYVKHLIVNDAKDESYPVFQASKQVEQSYQKAMKHYDSARVVTNVTAFLDSL